MHSSSSSSSSSVTTQNHQLLQEIRLTQRHQWEIDLIDLTPDKSMHIRVCKHCQLMMPFQKAYPICCDIPRDLPN